MLHRNRRHAWTASLQLISEGKRTKFQNFRYKQKLSACISSSTKFANSCRFSALARGDNRVILRVISDRICGLGHLWWDRFPHRRTRFPRSSRRSAVQHKAAMRLFFQLVLCTAAVSVHCLAGWSSTMTTPRGKHMRFPPPPLAAGAQPAQPKDRKIHILLTTVSSHSPALKMQWKFYGTPRVDLGRTQEEPAAQQKQHILG